MYKIKLSDGAILDNLKLNGNNYIPEVLDKSLFKNNLDIVTLSDNDGNVTTLYNQKVQFAKIGDVETFILSGKSNEELLQENLMLALAQLDMQREIDKTDNQLALAELATMLMGGNE